MFLLQFAKFIIVPFLSDWLDYKNQWKLLYACTTHECQELAALIVQYPNLFLQKNNESVEIRRELISWLRKKKLPFILRNVTLTSRFVRSIPSQQLDVLTTVEQCTCAHYTDMTIDHLIKLVPHLSNLLSIHIFNVKGKKIVSLIDILSKSCHQLVEIEIKGCEIWKTNNMTSLCRANPHLRSIDTDIVMETGDIFPALAVHCRFIEKVHLRYYLDRQKWTAPLTLTQ